MSQMKCNEKHYNAIIGGRRVIPYSILFLQESSVCFLVGCLIPVLSSFQHTHLTYSLLAFVFLLQGFFSITNFILLGISLLEYIIYNTVSFKTPIYSYVKFSSNIFSLGCSIVYKWKKARHSDIRLWSHMLDKSNLSALKVIYDLIRRLDKGLAPNLRKTSVVQNDSIRLSHILFAASLTFWTPFYPDVLIHSVLHMCFFIPNIDDIEPQSPSQDEFHCWFFFSAK